MSALEYHDVTKHHFNRFARSLGYLDWATQPDPFRRYAGTPVTELRHDEVAAGVPFASLYEAGAVPAGIDLGSLGEFLRCSMGLSAWKQYRASRWALRVNPSSGNLHPTEAYIVWEGRVGHYAPQAHLIEGRSVLGDQAWREFGGGARGFLVALTSIHWREAWKYGERAFRYCQHDVGHAIGTLRFAAGLLGWKLALLPRWSDSDLAALLGLDRAPDFGSAEPEFPECIAIVTPDELAPWLAANPDTLVSAAHAAEWNGTANRLSADRVEWPVIERVEASTRYPGLSSTPNSQPLALVQPPKPDLLGVGQASVVGSWEFANARNIILGRRSAVAFDGRSMLPRASFLSMLRRLDPISPPWDAIDWPPHVHLVLFVHRVEGQAPGIYAYLRAPAVLSEWRAAMRQDFLWEPVNANDPNDPNASTGLFLLVPLDVTWEASRLSCDQDIAGAGFFSLGMVARLESSLRERGEWFYRRLFWECGLIGQVLYLEAEAAGARSTGIGCFYDDPVHDTLGLSGHEWQSLYHFSMGMPVDDGRLTTEPGYPWEHR